jgi:hypothetical protein
MDEVIKIDDLDVIRNPSKLEDGDEVISFRTKTIDKVHKAKDGRFMLNNATKEFNWPVSFKPEFYGKLLKN